MAMQNLALSALQILTPWQMVSWCVQCTDQEVD